jgi:hypothetical protein
MSAEIINFTANQRVHRADELPRRRPAALSATAKNQRLRNERWEVWNEAAAATRDWHALLLLTTELLIAKNNGHTYRTRPLNLNGEDRRAVLDSYRDARGRQLLTPAATMAAVDWKRRHLNKFTGVDKEALAKIIAEDIAFLDAHPTKRARAER